jgi:hypothetical protein
MGDEMNIAHQHHLVISGNLLKSSLKQLIRVFVTSGEPLLIRADYPGGGSDEPLSIGIVVPPPNKGAYSLLDLLAGGAGDSPAGFTVEGGTEKPHH